MFAEKLKKLRKSKGIKQKELAKGLNVSVSAVAMWETEKREPDFETTRMIADYFNVSTDYLLGNTDDPTPPNKEKREVSLEEFLEQQGIENQKYVESLKEIIDLMKKNEHNDRLDDEISKGNYSTNQRA